MCFGFIANRVGANLIPSLYGPIITGFISIGYLCSSVFYWKSGKAYTKFMEQKELEVTEKDVDYYLATCWNFPGYAKSVNRFKNNKYTNDEANNLWALLPLLRSFNISC